MIMELKKDNMCDNGNVKVVCRFRPVNQSEMKRSGQEQICHFSKNKNSVTIHHSKSSTGSVSSNEFIFDRVFDTQVTQRKVYEKAAMPIIEGVLNGFNGTVFAYGQTGSGKTYTMQGPDIEDLEHQGIVPRMVGKVFDHINSLDDNIEYIIKVSMAEIYMENIRDLLDPTRVNLKIKQDKERGIYIQALTEQYITSEAEVYNIMKIGNDNRAFASTQMNDVSSRSHSIFMMNITQNNMDDHSSKSGNLYLVDLAGSEKVSKSNVKGMQLEEAKAINQSLSTLGKVINALTDKKAKHVPYRESKLTRILTESLGGNSKTCLIITCSPSSYNELETLSTLRFGTAARNIKNRPKVNRKYTIAKLKMIVSQKNKLVSALRKRILLLENFIKENGFKVPSKETLKELANKLRPEVDKIIQEEQEMNDEEEKYSSKKDLKCSKIDEDDDDGLIDEEQKEKAQRFCKLVESSTGISSEIRDKIIAEHLKIQKLLTQEREKYQKQVNLISNLQEDPQIFKSKIKNLSLKRENFDSHKEATEQKVNEFKEETEDAKNKLEITNAKMTKVERELDEIKKLYATAKAKVERYEEKGTEFMIDESKQNKEFRKEVIEGDKAIKTEIKALQDQIVQRDQLLNQIQQNTEVSSDLKEIIKVSQKKHLEQEKQNIADSNNLQIKKFLKEGSDYDLISTQDSCHLDPSDVEKITARHNENKSLFLNERPHKIKKKNSSLQANTASLSNTDESNMLSMANTIAENKIEGIKEEFNNEKQKIMENLRIKNEQILRLKRKADISHSKSSKLETTTNSDHSESTTIIQNYEQNIESLVLIHLQVSFELSVLKTELKVSQKHAQNLTSKLETAKSEIQKIYIENRKYKKIVSKLQAVVGNGTV